MAISSYRNGILFVIDLQALKLFSVFWVLFNLYFLNALLQKEKSSSSDGKENVAVSNEQDDVCKKSFLRLAPREGISIVAPSIRSGEFVTSSNISLMAYEKKFGADSSEITEHLKQVPNKIMS